MRQLVLTGMGNVDSAITVLGFLAGAAFSHNFNLASAADIYQEGTNLVTGGGTTANGRIAILTALLVMLAIGSVYTKRQIKPTVKQ